MHPAETGRPPETRTDIPYNESRKYDISHHLHQLFGFPMFLNRLDNGESFSTFGHNLDLLE
jgi:hypothetical protein